MNRSLFPTSVVTKAFTWAYQELGLSIKQASEILGISPSSLAQTTLLGFESGTIEYRKQLAFIRMYHLLISFFSFSFHFILFLTEYAYMFH